MINLKAWGMVAVAVLTGVYAALTDGGIDRTEWVVVINTAVGALVVWVVPNWAAGPAHFAKTVAAFASAGLTVLAVVIVGGLTQAELIEVILAGAAAIGLTAGVENKGYRFTGSPRSSPVLH